jgi:electron transport complex protein RnfG
MKEMVRYGSVLAIICALATASLAVVNSLTKAKIISQAQAEEESGLREVLPAGASFQAVRSGEEVIYYKAFDKDSKLIGVAFKAAGKGYSSTIETIVGMLTDGTITNIKVVAQNETPGLGARVAEADFAGRFSNRNLPGLKEVQAITGATISSKAVIDSVRRKAEEIKELIKNDPKQ